MKHRVAVLLAAMLTALLCSGAASAATIYVKNTSTALPDATIANAIPALQAQLDQDFAPVWNMDATVVLNDRPPARAWVMNVTDDATVAGALGYHDVCSQNGHGTPCGFVFARTTEQDGQDPIVTLDHELLELIADPYTTTMARANRRWYFQEVCDAPENDSYTRAGANGQPVALSDFVTPEWFRPGHVAPFDHLGLIKRPLGLRPGGYESWMDGTGKWHQATDRHGRVSVRRVNKRTALRERP